MYKFDNFGEKAEKAASRTIDHEDQTRLQMLTKFASKIHTSRHEQQKIYEMITTHGHDGHDEFGTIMQMIAFEQEKELRSSERGKATYLIAILITALDKSGVVWDKIIRLIDSRNVHKQYLDAVLAQKVVFNKIIDSIDRYFKSLVQYEDAFQSDVDNVPEDMRHLCDMQLSGMVIILHYLINHEAVGAAASARIFGEHNDLSPEFTKYLRSTLRIIDM
jgi:hypothetical protein